MNNQKDGDSASSPHANPDFPELLTRREIEILYWMAAGKSNEETANILYISKNTVRYHLKNIYRKLDVHNKAAAVSVATAMGIIVVPVTGWKKTIQTVYNNVVQGDINPLATLLDDASEWISTAPQTLFPHAGCYRGTQDILTQIGVIATIYEMKSFLPRIFVEEADQLAVYLDVSLLHRESQNEMFFDVAHFWTFRGEKIARYVEIFNSAVAEDQQHGARYPLS